MKRVEEVSVCETPIILESESGFEIDFLKFGLREAFGTRLGIKCTFTRKDIPALSEDFQKNLEKFVERSKRIAKKHATDRVCIHMTAGTAPITTEAGPEVVHFTLTSILRFGHVAHVEFEPFGEYENPEVYEFTSNVSATLAGMQIPVFASHDPQDNYISEVIQEGYRIGFQMLNEPVRATLT